MADEHGPVLRPNFHPRLVQHREVARRSASGLGVTRHPRMGAVEEPQVAVRELSENKRLIEKTWKSR
jgi:hypothetical protein